LPAEARQQLSERIAFALWACDRRSADLLAKLLMKADGLGFTTGLRTSISAGPEGTASTRRDIEVDTNQRKLDILQEKNALQLCLENLPVRDGARFLAFMGRDLEVATCDALLKLLPEMTAAVLDVACPFLLGKGREEACATWFSDTMLAPKARGETLLWLARTPASVERMCGMRSGDMAFRLVEWIGIGELEGRRLHREVRDLFSDRVWLGPVLETLAPHERAALIKRVQKCAGWEATGKRSALANMIKLYPELSEAAAEGEQDLGPRKMHLTSWRSFRERQAKLKELMEKTIPENSQEIAHARGYGDLRENFEYQSAKDKQRLLLRRKAELENDIDSVKGTDFAGLPTDEGGMGTTVTVRRPTGELESFCILGEWDRDEALGIISSKSKVGECLDGRRAGDAVTLPGAGGDVVCTVVEVQGLSDAVKQWLAAKL
jgi:transcription elongation GreA/GreB family factor